MDQTGKPSPLLKEEVGTTTLHRGVCEHGKRKHRCQQCGGAALCKHGREKFACQECGGFSFCVHGKLKWTCVQCGGKSTCKHGRQKYRCVLCGGKGVCEHGKQQFRCVACGGSQICEHGQRRHTCKACGGASICEHGKERRICGECFREASTVNPSRAVSTELQELGRQQVREQPLATQEQRTDRKRKDGNQAPESVARNSGMDFVNLELSARGAGVKYEDNFCDLTNDDDEADDGPSSSIGGSNHCQRQSSTAVPEVERMMQRLQEAERKAEEAKQDVEELRKQAVRLQRVEAGKRDETDERERKKQKVFEMLRAVSEMSDEERAMLRERGRAGQPEDVLEEGSQRARRHEQDGARRERKDFGETSCTIS